MRVVKDRSMPALRPRGGSIVTCKAGESGGKKGYRLSLHAAYLDAGLGESDGEVRVRLCCKEQLEIRGVVQASALQHGLQFMHEGQAQVAILDEQPAPFLHAPIQCGFCNFLLAIAL